MHIIAKTNTIALATKAKINPNNCLDNIIPSEINAVTNADIINEKTIIESILMALSFLDNVISLIPTIIISKCLNKEKATYYKMASNYFIYESDRYLSVTSIFIGLPKSSGLDDAVIN